MLEAAEKIRVFWMPGCTSCVKVKEFLAAEKVVFEAINYLTDPNAKDDLKKLGASSVPVVARGDKFVFAQSLDDVAAFLNLKVDFKRLPPPILMDRWFYFLETAKGLIADIPAEQLNFKPMADRDRTLHGLAFHIFQVPEAFLENLQNGLTDLNVVFDRPAPPDIKTTADIIDWGTAMTQRLRDWWSKVEDKSVPGTTPTFYGEQPIHTFMERSTWHTAQHVRQLGVVLDAMNATVKKPIAKAAYTGLPMPETIWA